MENEVDTFLFGSRSEFNDLCYKIVTEIKEKRPNVKRIYVRAEYQDINDDYKNYLLERYEATYYSKQIVKAGRAIYIKRNFEMINKSHFCVFYYGNKTAYKSGTKIALDYAQNQGKEILNIF